MVRRYSTYGSCSMHKLLCAAWRTLSCCPWHLSSKPELKHCTPSKRGTKTPEDESTCCIGIIHTCVVQDQQCNSNTQWYFWYIIYLQRVETLNSLKTARLWTLQPFVGSCNLGLGDIQLFLNMRLRVERLRKRLKRNDHETPKIQNSTWRVCKSEVLHCQLNDVFVQFHPSLVQTPQVHRVQISKSRTPKEASCTCFSSCTCHKAKHKALLLGKSNVSPYFNKTDCW